MISDGWTTPPIGTGGYAQWVVFVIVVMLAVALAEWMLAMAFRKR